MPTIGSLNATMGMDTAQFDAAIASSRKKLSDLSTFNFGKGLADGFKSVVGGMEEMASKAGGVGSALSAMGGAGLGAAVALGAIVEAFAQTRQALEFGNKIADAAKKIGVSTTTLQEYRFAVHDLGGSYADADTALDEFSKKFTAAQIGFSKKATKPFDALGLDPKSFGTVDEALKATIDKISGLGTAAQQNFAAEKVGLGAILPAIRAGSDAIDELRQKAHDLGFVMSEELIEKAEAANKKFEDLSSVINVQFKSAFVEAAPALLRLTQGVADLVTWLARVADSPGLVAVASIAGAFAKDGPLAGIAEVNRQSQKRIHDSQLPAQVSGKTDVDDPDSMRRQAITARGGALNDLTAPKKARNPQQVQETSDNDIAKAAKEELQARIALTADIANLAVLREAEIEEERAAANKRLEEDAAQGKITAAAAATAEALNNKTADEKKALVRRQAEEAADSENLAQKKEIGGYLDQVASVEASLATNAADRNAIEKKNLADRQRLDTLDLKSRLQKEVDSHLIEQADADQILASQADAQAAARQAQARAAAAALQAEANDRAEAALTLQIDLLTSQSAAARTQGAKDQIDEHILQLEQQLERQKLEEIVASVTATQTEKDIAAARLKQLPTIQANQTAAKLQADFDRSLTDSTSALEGFASAINSGDVGSAMQAFSKAMLQFAGSNGPLAAFAQELGAAGQVYSAGSSLGAALAKAIGGNTKTGSQVGGILGAIPGAIASLFGPGPSNFTASANFNGLTGATFGGDKPDQTTTSAAQQVAAAILQSEQALAAAVGVTLGPVVAGLQIGQRDKSKITLSNGQVVTSAVGDANAAVAAALNAVLSGAHFTDQAEQQLVTSMQAAGKGFDDIVTALGAYQQAQTALGAVADQLLQVTDPQAYDAKQVTDAIQTQLDAAAAAAKAGDITADQLTQVNAQLEKLRGLELDQVTQKYADAAVQAAQSLITSATSATSAAAQALDQAAAAAAAPLNAAISQFQAFADNLTSFAATLTDNGVTTALSYAQASALEASTAARARLGDTTALGTLQDAGTQFLTASKAQSGTLADYLRDQARVRNDALAAAATATRQVSVAQQQLDAINAQVAAAEGTTAAVEDVVTAIANLQAAQTAEAAAKAGVALPSPASGAPSTPPTTVPAFNAGDTSSLSPGSVPVIDTSGIDTSGFGGGISGQLSGILNATQAAAIAAAVQANILKQFNYAGMPGTRQGDTVLTQAA